MAAPSLIQDPNLHRVSNGSIRMRMEVGFKFKQNRISFRLTQQAVSWKYTNSQFLLCFNFRQRGKTRSHYHACGCVYYAAPRSDLQYVALRGPEDEPEQLNGAKPEDLDLSAGTHNLSFSRS
jgi:hypothetical protein